jgi:hypothetical protein
MCDVRLGFGKALSKKGLGNIIVRMVLLEGRRVSREQLKQDPRTKAYGLPTKADDKSCSVRRSTMRGELFPRVVLSIEPASNNRLHMECDSDNRLHIKTASDIRLLIKIASDI